MSTSGSVNIRGLPYELVREILLCVHFGSQGSLSSPFLGPNLRSSPLLLCQVCYQWRDIVINTPEFWNKISIVNHRPAPQLLKLWIERSGNLPFSFSWDFTRRVNATSTLRGRSRSDYKRRVMSLLWPIMRRWQSVMILDNHLPGTFGQYFSMDVDQFMIKNADLIQRLVPPPPLSSRRLVWSCIDFPVPRGNAPFWGALRCIKIENPLSLYDCIYTLPGCVNAVYIELGWITDDITSANTPIPQASLSRLECLVIGTGDFDVTRLLYVLYCPRLKFLLYGTMGVSDRSFRRLASFIQRSSCVLQKVAISDSSLDGPAASLYFSTSVFLDNIVDEFTVFPGPISGWRTRDLCSLIQLSLPANASLMRRQYGNYYSYGWVKRLSAPGGA